MQGERPNWMLSSGFCIYFPGDTMFNLTARIEKGNDIFNFFKLPPKNTPPGYSLPIKPIPEVFYKKGNRFSDFVEYLIGNTPKQKMRIIYQVCCNLGNLRMNNQTEQYTQRIKYNQVGKENYQFIFEQMKSLYASLGQRPWQKQASFNTQAKNSGDFTNTHNFSITQPTAQPVKPQKYMTAMNQQLMLKYGIANYQGTNVPCIGPCVSPIKFILHHTPYA